MCKACQDDAPDMRTTPLDENELALWAAVQRMPVDRLASRLPAWIKTHENAGAPPKPFVFKGGPPVYPSWTYKRPFRPIAWVIPAHLTDVAEYVRQYEHNANLVHVPCAAPV